jgi:hypothetical protein
VKTIKLPCFNIVVVCDEESGTGTIESKLRLAGQDSAGTDFEAFDARVDAVESMILAHACAGVDIASPAYIEGIESAIDAIVNYS